ncbi:phytoene desaturase, partial [Planococcus sp. SIMBA_143]
MENYFKDERLQLAYSLQALYIGGYPDRAPAMYSLVPFSEHEHGVYYVKGGYASIIPVMARELRGRGTGIRLDTAVKRVVKKDGR